MRSGLADAIGGISGLRCGEYVADIANVPAASVNLKKAAYDFVFENGKATYTFSVMVYFDRNNERAAQVFFDALMEPTGATSVKATVETDTVGTAMGVDIIDVKTANGVGQAVVGEVSYLAIEFEIEVVG
jgi:hypothetical protein